MSKVSGDDLFYATSNRWCTKPESVTMTNIEVYVLTLENDQGTRVKVGGYEVDEEPVEFGAAADIKALKNWIVNRDEEGNRRIGLIIVYTCYRAIGV